jgi:anti-sigma regulatory factor (Ser/Thr protein kinase)
MPADDPARVARVDLLTRDFDFHTLVQVRHEVERCGVRAGLTDRELYLFVVAVNEVITNAVRHGGGKGRLSLWRDGHRLHCRVVDQGPGIPPGSHGERRPAPDTIGGRGLWLARQSCESLTVDTGAHGSAVTLTQPVRPAQ